MNMGPSCRKTAESCPNIAERLDWPPFSKFAEARRDSMSLPREMTVVEIAAPGGPEQLKTAVRPMPQPGEDEVLVRVEAAGVNRPDVMQRQGPYPPPPGASDLPGMATPGQILPLQPRV